MPEGPSVKVMKLRYAGVCGCGRQLPAGTRAGYDRITRIVVRESCLASRGLGTPRPAGFSLERTYDKRKADREERVTTRFPRAGRFLLAVTPEPASTRAFKTGAEGEAKFRSRATPTRDRIYAEYMETRYVFVGGSRDGEFLTVDGELLTNIDSGIEDYQLDDPPMELSIEGSFAYVLHYHGLAAG